MLEELFRLQKDKSVKGCSHICRLCPLIGDGALRDSGRLRLSMPVEAKHPMILAKEFYISDIALRHIHQEVGHGGRNYVVSKLWERR